MSIYSLPSRKNRERGGQTLIIALIVLGVLLIVATYFLGIINRTINQAAGFNQRVSSTDLAEAGIRFAHYQLLNSTEGADWRPAQTPLTITRTVGAAQFTSDPDAIFLRPSSGFTLSNGLFDFGGPDGLGAFTRVNFANGRSLIRVRYAPSGADVIRNLPQPPGTLKDPGRARNYLIIESIGRPGQFIPNDPTLGPAPLPGNVARDLQVGGFASAQEAEEAISLGREGAGLDISTRQLIAMVPIGITEAGRFITNKSLSSRPAEIGYPEDLGARIGVDPVSSFVRMQWGSPIGLPLITGGEPVPFGGSLISNADLLVHGRHSVNLNKTLGDSWLVSGNISGASNNSVLDVNVVTVAQGGSTIGSQQSIVLTRDGNPSFSSRNINFSTAEGLIRDGSSRTDSRGFPRQVGRIEPPSITAVDPVSNLNRYQILTRNSGVNRRRGNSGQWGQGRGVYVGNTFDRQMRTDGDDRAQVGTAESLEYDWLNPNNGRVNRSGWDGAFYVPTGAYLLLQQDGFTITLDGQYDPSGETGFWRNRDGVSTGQKVNRYRIGPVTTLLPNGNTARVPYIINSFTTDPATNQFIDIDAANPNYALGQPFNGVLYFEGNVRVRGMIPTDIQLTVVSNATIYIEGSITKGIIETAWSQAYDNNSNPINSIIDRPSASTLMLMARDYVAFNSTQIVGRAADDSQRGLQRDPNPLSPNPVSMSSSGGSLSLVADLLLNPFTPGGSPLNPSTWQPYASTYRQIGNNSPIGTVLMLTQASAGNASSFIGMQINPGLGVTDGWNYRFDRGFPNGAGTLFTGSGPVVPIYGLTNPATQWAPRFEAMRFPIALNGSFANGGSNEWVGTSDYGNYRILGNFLNFFTIRPRPIGSSINADYQLARAALGPHNVRIEAAIYAEEGSFFVIPGVPFNFNPNDRRDYYEAGYSLGLTGEARDRIRYEQFGATPETPFFGETLPIRIDIIGAVSENMPPSMSKQAEWLRTWGWVPTALGATGLNVPDQVAGQASAGPLPPAFSNLSITYDPVLATGRPAGFSSDPLVPNSNRYVRRDEFGRPLPPMPRLPVSPTIAYFGEVR